MKKTILALCIAASCLIPGVVAAPVATHYTVAPPQGPLLSTKEFKARKAIAAFVRKVNQAVEPERLDAISTAIIREARAQKLDYMVLLGILAHESRFQPDLEVSHARGHDLGIAQIHWETWGKVWGLDRVRLITDDVYGIHIAARILADIRHRYGADKGWWSRFHDLRDPQRIEYAALVTKRVPLDVPEAARL